MCRKQPGRETTDHGLSGHKRLLESIDTGMNTGLLGTAVVTLQRKNGLQRNFTAIPWMALRRRRDGKTIMIDFVERMIV